jgi:tripartite motif-containing protein 37
VEWRLKVYPKGNGLAREKYLSVFVEMSKALGVQNKYEYRIELVNPSEPNLTVKREYCSTFEIGECWGYNQF